METGRWKFRCSFGYMEEMGQILEREKTVKISLDAQEWMDVC